MKEFEHDCCKVNRNSASDFLMRPMYRTNKMKEGYKMKTLVTPKGVIQLLWLRENQKVNVMYSGNPCLTSKIVLEALCEWVNNGQVKGVGDAIEKLSKIRGFKVTKDVEDLTREVMNTITE
ncbi:hypothetical protein [Sulfuracidifex tepidarius]|uniref:Uncharacterized protein n=1 Tax=Sulfuracidifex tepidarius TaxID=1294262 RepID=A0A510DZN7_9CREN|nr:hypothetical protein [Sulfuracidifex tepidarius]BBG22951.1 hypothetical protein IC006_0235 [Sulfuracidifex tepidarius]BBG25711.1 hypothetical protein IC007_0216 [Sulfuracidifex tepidarius]